jgi:non-homologous end joining protein Ku
MWTGGYTYLKKLGKRKQRNLLERLTKVVAVLIHEKTQNSLIRDRSKPRRSSIDLREFIPIEKVDPIYFESSYYLAPDKGADKHHSIIRLARYAQIK